jgi:hypothetical protein
MKKYKHKKTGEIATYKNGILKSSGFCVEIGVEPSKEFWELIQELPVGTKVVDTYSDFGNLVYEKLPDGHWKIGNADYITINEDSVGKGKRFQIVEETPLPKKDYEILQIKNKFDGNIITFNSKGEPIHRTDGCTLSCTLNLKDCLNTKSVYIFQVKRLSDNCIFTIGDKVKPTNVSVRDDRGFKEISKIEIYNNECLISTGCNYFSRAIKDVVKQSPVLFITEDGKEVKENDKYYVYFPEEDKIYGEYVACNDGSNYTKKYLNFSTKEAAENYRLFNNPCLSINDLNLLSTKPWDMTEIKKLVKSKLKQ